MESYWATIATASQPSYRTFIAYPSLSTLPPAVAQAPIEPIALNFGRGSLWEDLVFLFRHRVKLIYLSDRPSWDYRYLLYRLAGVRAIVVHDHSPGVRPPAQGLARILKTAAHRAPLISATKLIGATEFVKQRLIDVNCAPSARCKTVANGLPTTIDPILGVDIHELFGIPRQRLVVVMVSRASFYKGLDFALTCLAELTPQVLNRLHFLHCGDGPDLPALRIMAQRLGIDSHVTFAGRRADVPAILRNCAIAFHPSKGEVGYSLSILEYMEAGLPVVVPGNPSVSGATTDGKNGLVYPEGNVEAAAQALTRLATEPNLVKVLGQQGQIDVKRNYRLETAHQQLLQIILPLIGKAAPEVTMNSPSWHNRPEAGAALLQKAPAAE